MPYATTTHGQRTYIALLALLSVFLAIVLASASIAAADARSFIRSRERYRGLAQQRPSWSADQAEYYERDLRKVRPTFGVSAAAAVFAGLYLVYALALLGARVFARRAPAVRADWPAQAFWLVWAVVMGALWVNPALKRLNNEEWGLFQWSTWIWGPFVWVVAGFTLIRLLVEVIIVGRRSKTLSYWDTETEIHNMVPPTDLRGLNKKTATKEDV